MQANELRLGNLVASVYTDHFFEITSIDEGRICTEDSSLNINHIEGIPLTPEILEKAGFDYVTDKTFESKTFDIWVSEANGKYTFTGRPDGGILLEYLHQLQNLIYALTGQELIINL